MRRMMNVALLASVVFTFVGCISVHNNKGASDNMPAAIAKPAYYQVITELGKEPVSASVTGHNVLKIIKWGMPSTFADNGDFGAAGATAGPSLPIPLPLPLPIAGGDAYAKFKQSAVYIACRDNNCDSLLDARYAITTKDYFVYEQVTCKVTGIPVKITGYKQIEAPAKCCK